MEEQKDVPQQHSPPAPDISECEKQRDEYLNGWKRAKADLINYKKDEEARFREFAKLVHEGFLDELLPVLDSFELGLKGIPETDAGYRGLLIIKTQFEEILKRHGLERLTAIPGEQFNPSLHEASSEIESPHPPGAIAKEIRSGYFLRGKVIRPAQVAVSKGQK